jgi:hypothetical protein
VSLTNFEVDSNTTVDDAVVVAATMGKSGFLLKFRALL